MNAWYGKQRGGGGSNDVTGKRSKNEHNWIRCFANVGREKAVVIIKSVNKGGYQVSYAESNRIFRATEEIPYSIGRAKYSRSCVRAWEIKLTRWEREKGETKEGVEIGNFRINILLVVLGEETRRMTKGSGRKSELYGEKEKGTTKVWKTGGRLGQNSHQRRVLRGVSNLIPSPREITKYTVFSLQTVTITLMNLANEKR